MRKQASDPIRRATRRRRGGRRLLVPAAMVTTLLCAAAPAAAHDFWIEPSTFTPPAGSLLAVRLRVGQQFKGEPVPRDPDLILRFDLVGPDGHGDEVLGFAGWEPAGRVRAGDAGLRTLVYRSGPSPISLAADKFEDYLEQYGLEYVVAARAAKGASAEPGSEIFSRCAKALIDVQPHPGEAAPKGTGYDKPVGITLELVAEADPYRFAGGGDLPVQLLYEDHPLEGALVVAMPASDPTAALSARSDRQGRARFHLDRPGVWLVKAVHMVPAPSDSGADWESLWASLTFEVPAG